MCDSTKYHACETGQLPQMRVVVGLEGLIVYILREGSNRLYFTRLNQELTYIISTTPIIAVFKGFDLPQQKTSLVAEEAVVPQYHVTHFHADADRTK